MARLVTVTVKGYKCFRDAGTIIEPKGITSLTGGNDSGKSSFLWAIHMFFNHKARIIGDEVCTYSAKGVPTVEIEFECLRNDELQPIMNVAVHQNIIVRRELTRPVDKYELYQDNTWRGFPVDQVSKMFPKVLTISPDTFQRAYPRSNPPTLTGQTLGDKFSFAKPMGTVQKHSHEWETKREISHWLEQNWKANKKTDFDFVQDKDGNISYVMRDDIGEFRPIYLYGTGYQQFISKIIRLEVFKRSSSTKPCERLVLIDEPELSLHPRAQRHLLNYLRASGEELQTIYATHSSSMIDQSEPHRVRVFMLDAKKKNVRIFHKKSVHDNYGLVRMALGILPSDSLLFGRINLIVEGAIEFLCLPTISRLLREAGHEYLDFNQVSIINGQGRELPRMFKLAIATNQPTVALVDNDTAGQRYERDIRRYIEENSIQISYEPVLKWEIADKEESEFEDFLPLRKYIEATNKLCKPPSELTEGEFEQSPNRPYVSIVKNFLAQSNIKFDEYKTDVALEVTNKLQADEALPFQDNFRRLRETLETAAPVYSADLQVGSVE